MERPVFQSIGTPAEDLDTPALVVDMAAMERNIATLRSTLLSSASKVRPHVTSHKCPPIARAQLAAGGTVGGISVSGIGEAEVFAYAGFTDILVASEIVTPSKISRLCSLARSSDIKVAVDNPKNLRDLSEAAQAIDVTLAVLLDINTGLDLPGVQPGQPALDLAKDVASSRGLRFAGLMAPECFPTQEIHPDTIAESAKAIQSVLDTKEMVEKAGLEVETVSVGNTHDYESVAAMEGVTEVRLGSHPLLDHEYCQRHAEFLPAARVLTTVVSHPTASSAVVDAGHKALGPDRGLPVPDGVHGVTVVRLSAEHGILQLDVDAQNRVDLGTKLWLLPRDLELCVNQYNYFRVIRGGKLEAVWQIGARGRFD